MIECPICLQVVENLKSGSHVIPRWAMKMTKQDGHFASLDLKKKQAPKATRVQADLICNFWCVDCENRFRDDDANGARFFRERNYLIREIKPDSNVSDMGIEIHSPDCLNDLRSFILSLFLRWEVYARNTLGVSFLGPRFAFYAKAHAKSIFGDRNMCLILFKNDVLESSHSNPAKTRFEGRNCVMMVFCGYDIFLISDNRGLENSEFSKLISNKEIVILRSGGVRMPHINKFVQTIKSIGALSRKKQNK